MVNVAGMLKPCLAFGVGVHSAPKGAVAPTQEGVLRFDMVGVEVCRIQPLLGLRVFAMGRFVLRPFASGLAPGAPWCLRTCSRSSEQQRQECQVDELQAGIEPALAVLR